MGRQVAGDIRDPAGLSGTRHRLGAARSDRGAGIRAPARCCVTTLPARASMQRTVPPRRCFATGACDRSATSGTCRSTSKDRSSQGRRPTASRSAGSRQPDDLEAIHGILEAAFADDPGHHPEPFDRWVEEHTTSPSYDPTLWLLARDGDVPVGVLTASAGDDVGWVDYLAVLGSHRGRGIGSRTPATLVRDLRCPRAPAREAQRRRPERDRSDSRLRARRDASREPLGSVGAFPGERRG